jgi:hypothetical protein
VERQDRFWGQRALWEGKSIGAETHNSRASVELGISGAVPPSLLYLPGLQREKRAFCCCRLITECEKAA